MTCALIAGLRRRLPRDPQRPRRRGGRAHRAAALADARRCTPYSVASWIVNAVLCVAVGVGRRRWCRRPAGSTRRRRHHRLADPRRLDDRRRAGRDRRRRPGRPGDLDLARRQRARLGGPRRCSTWCAWSATSATGGSPGSRRSGWGQEMQPWGANRWWPLGADGAPHGGPAGRGAPHWRRDATSAPGCWPSEPAAPSAPARYATPLGLGLRLQRGPIIGWTLTIVLSRTDVRLGRRRDDTTSWPTPAERSPRSCGERASTPLLSMLITMIAMITTVFAIQTTAVAARRRGERHHRAAAGRCACRAPAGRLQRLLIPAVGSAVLLLGGGGTGAPATARSSGISDQTTAARAGRPDLLAGRHGLRRRRRRAVRVAAPAGGPADLGRAGRDVVRRPRRRRPAPARLWLLDVLPFSATPYLPFEPLSWTPADPVPPSPRRWAGPGSAASPGADVQPG